MNLSRQQLTILVVLFGVTVAVYARAFYRPAAASKSATPQASEPSQTPHPVSPDSPASSLTSSKLSAIPILPDPSPQRAAQRKDAVHQVWARDPFVQDLSSKSATATLALTGILWDANQPMAIINGQTLSVGQELDGYRVTSISPHHVSLTDGKQILELSITP